MSLSAAQSSRAEDEPRRRPAAPEISLPDGYSAGQVRARLRPHARCNNTEAMSYDGKGHDGYKRGEW